MKAIALLGGPEAEWPQEIKQILLTAKCRGDLLIGVDRGSILLEQLGFTPDLAVGDFDSLKQKELTKIACDVPDVRYSVPEKDFTDTELMIRDVFNDYQVEKLTLLGATGGRIDHFLVNLLMLLNPAVNQFAEQVEILDRQNLINFYNSGSHVVLRQKGYTYFGVVSLTAVTQLNITNAKYNLLDYDGSYPVAFSSNEFLPQANSFNLSFIKGTVAVIQAKDIDRYQNI
ncbi:thiamine diphosphokinase [Lactobacillus sp. ESL0679]|uniref:thiamine diphosphokinase n=1 Tax=Lactobacillus sp. ESL0679 TaxID=2983209 RepID=UPI0023F7C15A|nr:thiamine diphosphokinase [Lactobacillus sp. ESL0679]MDF7683174.1 thiamine diphosphokinase [Lactobacillus sp. ESL0679]